MDHLTGTSPPATVPAPPTALLESRDAPAATTVRCGRGALIAIDGVTGVGKTYLTGHALDGLPDPPLTLAGFSQPARTAPGLGTGLLRALRDASGGDPFLRGGTPLAETLTLLAIKRHDFDLVLPRLALGRAVLEGRSVDTTAVCQALLLHPGDPGAALDTATALLSLASFYRPPPDLTILITDDPCHAITRTQHRDHYVLTRDQAAYLRDASTLYEQLAATDPARYRVLDRRVTGAREAAEQIRTWITDAATGLPCLREPWTGPAAPCLCCGHASPADPA
ncbi:hypothetical protein [Amycolatopsis thailandensis]|uniref:hypothetical protein n=1 Tax=Amycolatopsis thailandensis TaxID=589330 RepID=UPI001ABFCA7F|nr:hypothetical protein [Amycolatopsis thailandensis]